MGYNTDFYGHLDFDRQVSPEHVVEYNKFTEERHEVSEGYQGYPGYYCQWVLDSESVQLEWDGHEKFYNYSEWLIYTIEKFFKPWGYKLNGEIAWNGDENGDQGVIYVKDNVVEAVINQITNPGPSWDLKTREQE